MKAPTDEQSAWAKQAFEYTRDFFRESNDAGLGDFTPMLRLLDHLRNHTSFGCLSVWKSMYSLSISAAAHVYRPHSLITNAPTIGILQLPFEFQFRIRNEGKRRCSFENATDVLDNQLISLSMLCTDFDTRKGCIATE